MSTRFTTLHRQRWLVAVALLAFALRALIPAGFMPGGAGALTLQVCPDGFPVALLAAGDPHAAHHHHHSDGGAEHDHRSWTSGHCVFSAVAGAPLLAHSPVVPVLAETAALGVRVDVTPISVGIRYRIAQPRGPPRLV